MSKLLNSDPTPTKSSVGVDAAIRRRIARAKDGQVFTPANFIDLGSRAAIDKALSRLTSSGKLQRLSRGLYTRVPLKLAFLTDGVSRTVRVGGQQITLKHTTPRSIATAGRISGLVIQALRHLKQPRVDSNIIATLQRRLSAKDKAVLLTDAPLAPAWIAIIMRQIAANKD